MKLNKVYLGIFLAFGLKRSSAVGGCSLVAVFSRGIKSSPVVLCSLKMTLFVSLIPLTNS